MDGTVRIASRKEIMHLPRWSRAFAGERKDHRFYELIEDTLKDGFSYGYFVVENGADVCAIQPYFILDQDLLQPPVYLGGNTGCERNGRRNLSSLSQCVCPIAPAV
jgi:hypothetical protein